MLANLEFHRQGIGLVPSSGPGQEGSAIFVELPESSRPLRSCTCKTSRRRTCTHLKELAKGVDAFREVYDGQSWNQVFSNTVWYRLTRLLFESSQLPCTDIRVRQTELDSGAVIQVTSARGPEVVRYLDASPARVRFLERTGKAPSFNGFVNRAGLLDRLYLFQATPEERQLNKHEVQTNRQAWEASLWYRLAYHCVREFGDGSVTASEGSFHPAVNKANGDFTLSFRRGDEDPVLMIIVPRPRVEAVLRLLRKSFPEQEDLQIHPIPLKSIFYVTPQTELDMLVRPVISTIQVKGFRRYVSRPDFRKFRYGSLFFVRELGVLAELERDGQVRKFRPPKMLRLTRGQLASYVEENSSQPEEEGSLVFDEPLRGPEIFKTYDYVQVSAEALDRSWYWLAVDYGFGNQSISFEDILKGRKQGLPYLETPQGWIDLNSPLFDHLEKLKKRVETRGRGNKKALKLSVAELLRFRAGNNQPIRVGGKKDRAAILEKLFDFKPSKPFEPHSGLTSQLRSYQQIGVDWLRYLQENLLGGLLCDDMGLGKTHQAIALMTSLRAFEKVEGPFVVFCPTSVISHWRNKIREFAPGLHGFVYHGPERDFAEALRVADVIITSYGILRNDQLEFGEVSFPLAVFDEVQHIKNRDTLGYEAAEQLDAAVKLGLTGTPIENSLEELKALFDLILPGYLGSNESFNQRYGRAQEDDEANAQRLEELRRIISPFILRRLKISVLDELPEKIEDVRTCELSDDQVKLYRDAIATRAAPLIDRIKADDAPLPYIHIFALLNYLKQICDHPALALKEDGSKKLRSGKWDLYREILQECLDSGLKVVVFTQYLGMIKMMEEHLDGLGVEYVKLTGASTARGDIVDRFNEDPDCRVFLGSLKAGGTGIDLVGGSVVIHYDRWWNAAREDQATDRVHRIGQKQAVQVFKLLTEGTLEEKIDAIIDKKRELMETVVQEDDPRLSKIFSREELLAMLQNPFSNQ